MKYKPRNAFEEEVWREYWEAERKIPRWWHRGPRLGKLFGNACACLMAAVILFGFWIKHHNTDRNAIPSQAWSFGEPGE
jgi:hypothetical protein